MTLFDIILCQRDTYNSLRRRSAAAALAGGGLGPIAEKAPGASRHRGSGAKGCLPALLCPSACMMYLGHDTIWISMIIHGFSLLTDR